MGFRQVSEAIRKTYNVESKRCSFLSFQHPRESREKYHTSTTLVFICCCGTTDFNCGLRDSNPFRSFFDANAKCVGIACFPLVLLDFLHLFGL